MNKRILFIFAILNTTACFAALTVNPVNISKNNAALEAQIDEACKSQKDNIGLYVKCEDQLINKDQDAGLFEGSKTYAEKNYKTLESDTLYHKMLQLIELRKTARTYVDSLDDHAPGELTKEDYTSEISWIQAELNKRHYMTASQKKHDKWYKDHVTVI